MDLCFHEKKIQIYLSQTSESTFHNIPLCCWTTVTQACGHTWPTCNTTYGTQAHVAHMQTTYGSVPTGKPHPQP
jgi:hypothetical protein